MKMYSLTHVLFFGGGELRDPRGAAFGKSLLESIPAAEKMNEEHARVKLSNYQQVTHTHTPTENNTPDTETHAHDKSNTPNLQNEHLPHTLNSARRWCDDGACHLPRPGGWPRVRVNP